MLVRAFYKKKQYLGVHFLAAKGNWITTYTRHVVSDGDLWGLIQNLSSLGLSHPVGIWATREAEEWSAWRGHTPKCYVGARLGRLQLLRSACQRSIKANLVISGIKVTWWLGQSPTIIGIRISPRANTYITLPTCQALFNSFSSYNSP